MMKRLLLPREWGPLRYAELWQEDDALLYVYSSRFSDKYTRYRFRDIQAFVLTEHPLWNGWKACWLGGTGGLTAVLATLPPHWWKLFALLPGVFFVWAIAYMARGPRCRLVMHTAVSTVTIEAVKTAAQARVALPELRRLTESAQGRLSADGMTVEAVGPGAAPAEADGGRNTTPLVLHLLFGTMLLHALALAGYYFAEKMDDGLAMSGSLLIAEVLMAGVAALRWRTAGPLLTGLSALIVLLAVVDGGVLAYAAFKSLGGFFGALQRSRVPASGIDWLWLKEQTAGRAAWHAVFGVAGWALTLSRREKTA